MLSPGISKLMSFLHSKNPPMAKTLLIILANDVHQNPGSPFCNSFLPFMSWNAKDNFQRVRLIAEYNSIFNYERIAICETSLNDSIKLPDILLGVYNFVPSKNPTNTRHAEVGLVFKNSLPIMIRNDPSFDQSIVVGLIIGLNRSPDFIHTSSEFMEFFSKFNNLYSKIKNENPYASFFYWGF